MKLTSSKGKRVQSRSVPEKPAERSTPKPAQRHALKPVEPKTKEEPKKKQPKVKKPVPRFYKGLLIFAAVMIVCICIGTYIFWGYIAAYEASRSEHLVEELIENIDYDFWERQVRSDLTPQLTEFQINHSESVLEPYLSKARDVDYTIRQNRNQSTDDVLVYTIRAGARDIGSVRMVALQEAGYGFYLWEIESIEYLPSFTEGFSSSVTITASQSAQVEINGVPVPDTYEIPSEAEYAKTYHIANIFGDVEVTVTEWDGQVSEPYFADGGYYIYTVIEPFSRKIDVIAPNDVDVFVDGEKLTSGNITESRITPAIFDDFIEPGQVPLYSIRYELEKDGLYAEPEITAVDSQNRELIRSVSDKGQIIYRLAYSEEYKEANIDRVEEFIRAYVAYNANINGDDQANFNVLSKYMVKNSDLYNRAYAARIGSGVTWTGGSSLTYNSLDIDNFMPYGNDYFTCEIRYNLTHKTLYEERENAGSFEVIFVRQENEWLAARMINIE